MLYRGRRSVSEAKGYSTQSYFLLPRGLDTFLGGGEGRGGDGMGFSLNIFAVSHLKQAVLWINSYGVAIQMKPLKQYFHMVLFI